MRIKRFLEANVEDISPEKVNDIIDLLSKMAKEFEYNREVLDKVVKDLENFKSDSSESNDQIDDSVINLDASKVKLQDMLSSIDSVVLNLKDYNESGRKFLY
jgi:t-SNARE complex subunit (syntaxin)